MFKHQSVPSPFLPDNHVLASIRETREKEGEGGGPRRRGDTPFFFFLFAHTDPALAGVRNTDVAPPAPLPRLDNKSLLVTPPS